MRHLGQVAQRLLGCLKGKLAMAWLCGHTRRARLKIAPVVWLLEPRVLLASYADFSWDEARDYYYDVFEPTGDVPADWDGDVASGIPGTLGAQYRQAILDRVNQYRFMVGLSDVTFDASYDARAQAAALMMSANHSLDHTPPDTWLHWTPEGYDGASHSNLYLGTSGTDAIDGYMLDPGSSNASFVGHRRWVIQPGRPIFGVGDIPADTGSSNSNALYVSGAGSTPGPYERPDFVTWPPRGYVPYRLLPDTWSYSFFSGSTVPYLSPLTTVTVTLDGVPQAVEILNPGTGPQYGMSPALVWSVPRMTRPPVGVGVYEVTIQTPRSGADPLTLTYQVNVFDPYPTTFKFEPFSGFASESSGYASVDVTRSGDVSSTNSIRFHTRDDEAHAGIDYVATSALLVFQPGVIKKTIQIPLIDDAVENPEPLRSFEIVLSDPSRGTKLESQPVSVLIQDDDFLKPKPRPKPQPPPDTRPPQLVRTFRVNRAKQVKSVVLLFNEPLGAVGSGAITLYRRKSRKFVPIKTTIVHQGSVLRVRVLSRVATRSRVRIRLDGLRDLAGNEMSRQLWV